MFKKRNTNKNNRKSNFEKLSIFQPQKYKFKRKCPLSGKGAPVIDWSDVQCVTKVEADPNQVDLARFGVAVCAQVKSNCVIFIQPTETGFATVGIGPGQTSRVEAVRIAARRAGERAQGAMMVSDAFFPFRDGIDTSHEMGITAVVQPGGSIRDAEAIEAADEHGMTMLFTGTRLFRH